MNAIYKVIWNDALRLYQVVNEMCRSRRKACSVKACTWKDLVALSSGAFWLPLQPSQ